MAWRPLRQTASWLGGKGRERIGTEWEKRDRKQEKGKEGKLEQGRRWAKAGPVSCCQSANLACTVEGDFTVVICL